MADDSDFEDPVPAQEEEEADDMLQVPVSPNSAKEEEDDYECPEEDDQEEPEAQKENASAPVVAPQQALKEAYVMGNKVAYSVPFVGPDMKGPGMYGTLEPSKSTHSGS